VESLLGLRRTPGKLELAPCLPPEWTGYEIDYRYGESLYRIVLRQSADAKGAQRVSVDGNVQPTAAIALVDDGQEHRVEIVVPLAATPQLPQDVPMGAASAASS
jgi:cellobiose phosphorylase